MKSKSVQVTDGEQVTLPNSVEEIEAAVETSGQMVGVYIHAVYAEDDRYSQTTYTVRVQEAWDDSDLDNVAGEYSFLCHNRGLNFYRVALVEIED